MRELLQAFADPRALHALRLGKAVLILIVLMKTGFVGVRLDWQPTSWNYTVIDHLPILISVLFFIFH